MSLFKTIVAAVDFSGTSGEVVQALGEIAAPDSEIYLVHVVAEPLQQPWTVEAPGIDVAALRDTWVAQAAARLKALEIPARGRVNKQVLVGTPAEEIVRFARRSGADLIVMGTHGYGPVRRFLLGSVADRVVREASCPVLLFPHRDLRGPKVRRENEAFAFDSR
jgi:nucleotide-binding universal stress UspA family protein